MKITPYVEEAAMALGLPKELQEVMGTISYDPGDAEWYSTYHEFRETAIPAEVFSWALRLIGWLQYAYPQGPAFPEASWG
jgi:hypothetical protein